MVDQHGLGHRTSRRRRPPHAFFSSSIARNASWLLLAGAARAMSTSRPPAAADDGPASPALTNVDPGAPSPAGRFLSAPRPILPFADLGRGAGRNSVDGVKSVAVDEPAAALGGGGAWMEPRGKRWVPTSSGSETLSNGNGLWLRRILPTA